jgi:hypothetical protein
MVTLTIFILVFQTRLIVDISAFLFTTAILDASCSLLSMLITNYANHLLNALTVKRDPACAEPLSCRYYDFGLILVLSDLNATLDCHKEASHTHDAASNNRIMRTMHL